MSDRKRLKHNDPLQGVNLGGWLVLERWMTESLFAGTAARDEYELMKTPGVRARVKQHRERFVTEADFAWLQSHGVNAVRIPVGYWLFEAQDGYTPTVTYLDQAMVWAERYGIRVLVDLHGAPGSQNGRDHSGRIGQAGWFLHRRYREQTIELLCQIVRRYKEAPAFWGIELLNEPAARGYYWLLVKFYREAYARLCAEASAGTHIVFHDGFYPMLFAGVLWRRSCPVVMDVHWYSFESGLMEFDRFLRCTMRWRRGLLWYIRRWQPVIVGEWSAVVPRGFLEKFDDSTRRQQLARYVACQQVVYRSALGSFYWNYKTEERGMWHFRSLVEDGVLKLDSVELGHS